MMPARLLTEALRDPASLLPLEGRGWTSLIAAARAESLIGALAHRMEGQPLPQGVERLLADTRRTHEQIRVAALWEAEMARRALSPLGIPIILLKGTAYLAANLDAGTGRSIGDLDILVPHDALPAVEQALLACGWEWVKEDPYDQLYYRCWMHELPPLIHRERDRMIDVHHNILPLTTRAQPDIDAMIGGRITLPNGLSVLSPEDMIVHAAAHLVADGDLAGGLRNLWDIDRLLRQFSGKAGFWDRLTVRSRRHQLGAAVTRALRLAHHLYGTPVDPALCGRNRMTDNIFIQRMLARNGWGQATRPALRFGFYVRSHWLRMPPLMLARHLAIKAMR